MATGFAFKQSLHLCSVLNLRIVLAFRARKLSGAFEVPGPNADYEKPEALQISQYVGRRGKYVPCVTVASKNAARLMT